MNYFERNQRWLAPLMAILVLSTTPLLMGIIGAADGPAFEPPKWMILLSQVGIALGCFSAGLGAAFTNTLSADIIKVVLPGIGAGMVLMLAGLTLQLTLAGTVLLWAIFVFFSLRGRVG